MMVSNFCRVALDSAVMVTFQLLMPNSITTLTTTEDSIASLADFRTPTNKKHNFFMQPGVGKATYFSFLQRKSQFS